MRETEPAKATEGPRPRGAGQGGEAAERKRLTRTGHAFEEIEARLLDLTYPPGTTFTESELAESLHLTKTPVREALLMLSTVGLVTARPGSGYLVMPITLKDVRSLFRHWRRLEGDAAALAAGSGVTSHSVMHLTELVKGTGDAARLSIVECDAQLHSWIVSMAGDEYLSRDFHRLQAEIIRLFRLSLGDNPEGLREEHADLLRAVLSEEPDTARAAVLGFVDRVEKLTIEALLSNDALLTTNLGLSGR